MEDLLYIYRWRTYPLCHFRFVFLVLPQVFQFSLLLLKWLIRLSTRVHHFKQVLNHLHQQSSSSPSVMPNITCLSVMPLQWMILMGFHIHSLFSFLLGSNLEQVLKVGRRYSVFLDHLLQLSLEILEQSGRVVVAERLEGHRAIVVPLRRQLYIFYLFL